MPRRLRRPAAPETLPPDVLPPDFLERHGLIHRLYLRPLTGLTPPRPWEPLSDAEWDAVGPPSSARRAAAGWGRAPAAPWPTRAPASTPSSAPSS